MHALTRPDPNVVSAGPLARAATAGMRRPIVPSGVLAMLAFVIAEIMFFGGLVSAYLITRASVGQWSWPPPNQPRLPIAATAVNTLALLASAAVLLYGQRLLRKSTASAGRALAAAVALGAFFLIGQGREWVALIREGLTLRSSLHGSFFYIIVGCHGLHALAALCALGVALAMLARNRLRSETLAAISVFWYFVAGIWPFLYYELYL